MYRNGPRPHTGTEGFLARRLQGRLAKVRGRDGLAEHVGIEGDDDIDRVPALDRAEADIADGTCN